MSVDRSALIPSVSITVPETRVSPPETLSIQAARSTSESLETCPCSQKTARIAFISGSVGIFVGTLVAGAMEIFAQDADLIDQKVIGLSSTFAALGGAAITGAILSRLCCYTSSTAEDNESISYTEQRETESQFSSAPPSYGEAVGSDHSYASETETETDYLPSYDEVVGQNKVLNWHAF